jgi:hypothetical protein
MGFLDEEAMKRAKRMKRRFVQFQGIHFGPEKWGVRREFRGKYFLRSGILGAISCLVNRNLWWHRAGDRNRAFKVGKYE